jgi:hypothetical protein
MNTKTITIGSGTAVHVAYFLDDERISGSLCNPYAWEKSRIRVSDRPATCPRCAKATTRAAESQQLQTQQDEQQQDEQQLCSASFGANRICDLPAGHAGGHETSVPLAPRYVPQYAQQHCLASFGGYGACTLAPGHSGDHSDAHGHVFAATPVEQTHEYVRDETSEYGACAVCGSSERYVVHVRPSQSAQRFIIATSGPLIRKDFESVADMQEYVERNVPMKRGWSGAWEQQGERLRFIVRNSRGTYQHEIRVRPEDERVN